MDQLMSRQVTFYIRLHYPMRINATCNGFRGSYPDLPGFSCTDWDLPRLYATLEEKRRDWITQCVSSGRSVPCPNSHLVASRREPRRHHESSHESSQPMAASA